MSHDHTRNVGRPTDCHTNMKTLQITREEMKQLKNLYPHMLGTISLAAMFGVGRVGVIENSPISEEGRGLSTLGDKDAQGLGRGA